MLKTLSKCYSTPQIFSNPHNSSMQCFNAWTSPKLSKIYDRNLVWRHLSNNEYFYFRNTPPVYTPCPKEYRRNKLLGHRMIQLFCFWRGPTESEEMKTEYSSMPNIKRYVWDEGTFRTLNCSTYRYGISILDEFGVLEVTSGASYVILPFDNFAWSWVICLKFHSNNTATSTIIKFVKTCHYIYRGILIQPKTKALQTGRAKGCRENLITDSCNGHILTSFHFSY